MTDFSRQRWLILAHAFNMDGRAASQTITDKIPYLRQAGIDLVVLSGVAGTMDAVLEHHQLWPAGPAGLRFELRHVLRRRFANRSVYRVLVTLATLVLLPGLIIEKLLRPVESSWSWWLSAYLKGYALAREQPFDLIYSTGGAFAAHLAGRALKHSLGTPWLAEVHDPFVTPGNTPHTAQQKMQARVERMICCEANVAIWFTDQALASARVRHPELGDSGKVMLPGSDRPFLELPPYQPGPKFIVGYFGSLSATRNLVPFLKALEDLQASRPEIVAAIELHVMGGPLDAMSAAKLDRSSVRSCVRHLGRVEADAVTGLSGREQILRRMRGVDVLLLLHGEEPICEEYIPSKLYEYLWMQRPIVATVHRNPQLAAMLRDAGHVVVQTGRPGQDEEAVCSELALVLQQLFERWRSPPGLSDSQYDSPYSTQSAVNCLLGCVAPLLRRSA
jgi:glycosyltransferase involved in cell wall biosynthesis